MPTYELKCNPCGSRFEKFLGRLLRDTDKVCPECGSSDVRTGLGGGILGVGTTPTKSASCADRGFS